MASIKAVEFIRALDDSDLDVYAKAFLLRVWRRGACWERLQSIASTTGMSIGKASEVRRNLLEKGWLNLIEANGRIAYEVAVPIVAEVHEVKPEPVAEVHVVKPEFHEVKPEFHVVNALPINKTKEDLPIKYIDAREDDAPNVDDPEREGRQAAWDAIRELIQFWEQLTKRRRPADGTPALRDNWVKPFNEIWLICGRDIDAAKARVQAVRDKMLARGGAIFDPAKLPAHVQALNDAELIPMTERLNGNGHRPNFKNDPEAREAHNRKVLDEVFREIQSGGLQLWQ